MRFGVRWDANVEETLPCLSTVRMVYSCMQLKVFTCYYKWVGWNACGTEEYPASPPPPPTCTSHCFYAIVNMCLLDTRFSNQFSLLAEPHVHWTHIHNCVQCVYYRKCVVMWACNPTPYTFQPTYHKVWKGLLFYFSNFKIVGVKIY